MANPSYAVVAEVPVDPESATVHPAGWQSWSPEGTYPVGSASPVPLREVWQTMAFRPERPGTGEGFQGEGMLAVDPGDGAPVRVVSGETFSDDIPSIRARLVRPDLLEVSADTAVRVTEHLGGLPSALREWASDVASRVETGSGSVAGPAVGGRAPAGEGGAPTGTGRPPRGLPVAGRSFPAVWCSWYCYWRAVRASDVLDNAAAARRLGIDLGVVQIDDGWQAAIGDWDRVDPRFGDLPRTVGRLREDGYEVGIWLAPFLAVEDSALARQHPDWLLGEVDAGFNWDSRLRVLDSTHPAAAAYLQGCVEWLAGLGVTYFKLDFLYAGAMDGRRRAPVGALDSYRATLAMLRQAAGPGATILGCGAPLLASVGLVDAMRVSPDVMPSWEPPEGDLSQPGGRAASLAGAARAHLDRRWWLNDPDCLLARPGVERREDWAAHLRRVGGLASCSDPFEALDAWGLEVTRELMRPVQL